MRTGTCIVFDDLPQSTADLMVPNLISWRQFGKTSYSVNWNVGGKCIALLQCVQYEVPKNSTLHVYAVIVSFQDRTIYLLQCVLEFVLSGCWGKYRCPQKHKDWKLNSIP